MKYVIAIFISLALLSSSGKAQQGIVAGIGPTVSMKSGINAIESPPGRENKFAFGSLPDLGITTFFEFANSEKLGAGLDLLYSSYYYDVESNADGNKYNVRVSYYSFMPYFKFDYITMGFNFGIPASAEADDEIDVENVMMMTEFRLGFAYPILDDDSGKLSIFLNAGYMLSGIYDKYTENDPLLNVAPVPEGEITDNFNPRALSISLGFNYLVKFNI